LVNGKSAFKKSRLGVKSETAFFTLFVADVKEFWLMI
jgi:hypothetical protein